MKAAVGTPTGSRSGQRHGRLEDRDRVVGERADGAAGEARHALGRLDAAARDEGPDGVERVRRLERLDRQVRRVGRDGDRPGLDPGQAVAHLEQAPRPDAEERVAPEPLAALDGFEQVGRAAVVEAEEGADRGLEVGRTRGAQQDRVGVGGEALGLRQADRVRGASSRLASENQETTVRPRDERSCLPRCHPHSACAALIVTDGPGSRPVAIGAARYRWRSAPEPTGVGGSPPRVRSGGSRVHSLSLSPRFPPATGSLCRRATGTRPVHSPFFVMWRGWWQGAPRASSASRRPRTIAARSVGGSHALRLERRSDASAFLALAGPWLGAREAEHNLILGIRRPARDAAVRRRGAAVPGRRVDARGSWRPRPGPRRPARSCPRWTTRDAIELLAADVAASTPEVTESGGASRTHGSPLALGALSPSSAATPERGCRSGRSG